ASDGNARRFSRESAKGTRRNDRRAPAKKPRIPRAGDTQCSDVDVFGRPREAGPEQSGAAPSESATLMPPLRASEWISLLAFSALVASAWWLHLDRVRLIKVTAIGSA